MTTAIPTGHNWPPPVSTPSVSHSSGETPQNQTHTSVQAQVSPPFFSPATHVDPSTGIAVLVVLDDQGKIVQQLPSQQVVDEYKRHQGPDVTPSSTQATTQSSPGTTTPQVHTADASGTADSSGQGNTGSSSQH